MEEMVGDVLCDASQMSEPLQASSASIEFYAAEYFYCHPAISLAAAYSLHM